MEFGFQFLLLRCFTKASLSHNVYHISNWWSCGTDKKQHPVLFTEQPIISTTYANYIPFMSPMEALKENIMASYWIPPSFLQRSHLKQLCKCLLAVATTAMSWMTPDGDGDITIVACLHTDIEYLSRHKCYEKRKSVHFSFWNFFFF